MSIVMARARLHAVHGMSVAREMQAKPRQTSDDREHGVRLLRAAALPRACSIGQEFADRPAIRPRVRQVWTSVFGSERLTAALLDRLTHHVHILEMNGDSYRLNQSKRRSRRASSDPPPDNPTQA
jgi:hypothetical protein